ncbi:MAG: DHH family phosphoesterase [Eubacterium sp.]|nr:DHH family phosphoesterase [Eubacterium sp.]
MDKTKLNGTLISYVRWPLLFIPLLIVMNIHIYSVDKKVGMLMSCYVVLYIVLATLLQHFKKKTLVRDVVEFAMRYNDDVHKYISESSIPFAITDAEGVCLWYNETFYSLFINIDTKKEFLISDCIDKLTTKYYPENINEDNDFHFNCEERYYKATISMINGGHFCIAISDETDIVSIIRDNANQRLDVGFLYIDNYDESIDQLDEVRRSLVVAIVEQKINKYMQGIDAISKKIENDKFVFFFQHQYLQSLKDNKFSLIDEIHGIEVEGGPAPTISIGIGLHDENYQKKQEFARSAIDLALARGGDQAVIKSKDNTLFFGGKSQQKEKTTRVKARVKAHALRESILQAEDVIIMGHSLPDADALGSAIGIYRIATDLGKESHIVVNRVTDSLNPLINLFQGNPDYREDMFVNGETAKEFISRRTLLIVVDVNRPSYTDEPELCDLASTIVVLDHHRLTGDGFTNPTLSYIETTASSASEMVAEIIQYVGDDIKCKSLDADALYAGILLDTNYFMNEAGVRTFEAVAFLRRIGADITRIRKLFRSDASDYKVRSEAFRTMEIFLDHYAIALCNANECESPTIVGAKIANELLDIKGLKASFVLTEYEGKIYISARSIDELNVQLVMERLGGGGHMTSAGAQLENISLEEGRAVLKETLTKMNDEGDL